MRNIDINLKNNEEYFFKKEYSVHKLTPLVSGWEKGMECQLFCKFGSGVSFPHNRV